jgi:hypothetical protein
VTRAIVAAVVVVVALLAGSVVVYRRAFREPGALAAETAPPPPPPAPAPTIAGAASDTVTTTARLVAARGAVQVRRGEGNWRDAVADEVLNADDSVRAGRGAEATIMMGDGVEVRLSPRSELSVRELGEAASRIRLEEGHVTANVDGGRRRILRVQARGSDAEAESRGGSFGVVTDGRGTLAVATGTGSVRLTSGGASVDVAAGQSSSVASGQAPATPQATPGSLFLKLGALATQTNQASTTVQGTTTPGAIVRVGETSATADGRGRFALKVPLKDGRNELAVEVVDAAGRAETEDLPAVVVDRRKPDIDAAVRWGR